MDFTSKKLVSPPKNAWIRYLWENFFKKMAPANSLKLNQCQKAFSLILINNILINLLLSMNVGIPKSLQTFLVEKNTRFIFWHQSWITFLPHCQSPKRQGWLHPMKRKDPSSGLSWVWHETASDGEALHLLFWGEDRATPLLILQSPLWVIISVWVKFMGQIDQKRGVNVLGSDIVVSEFELQSRYYVHFQWNTLQVGMN